jgi:hypothetical protein
MAIFASGLKVFAFKFVSGKVVIEFYFIHDHNPEVPSEMFAMTFMTLFANNLRRPVVSFWD